MGCRNDCGRPRTIGSLARQHWFYILLPFLAAGSWGFRSTHIWAEQAPSGEFVTMLDWCLVVPLLFALCYRGLPRRVLAVRCLALACAGLWIAGKVVPADAQVLLSHSGPARAIGLVVVCMIEGAAVLATIRMTFGAEPDPAVLERQGVPPLVARLMLAEARFWRRVIAWMRRR